MLKLNQSRRIIECLRRARLTATVPLREFFVRVFCAKAARGFSGILAGWLLTGCAGDLTVRKVNPLREKSAVFAGTMSAAVRAQRAAQAERAGGLYLREMERLNGATSNDAQEAQRFATGRLIELCAPRLLADPQPGALTFAAPEGGRSYLVSLQKGAGRAGIAPGKFTSLEPADRFAVTSATGMSRQKGAGAPLVGHLQPIAPLQRGIAAARKVTGLHWAVTAVPVFGPLRGGLRSVALELYDPQDAASVAADFTTPLATANTLQAGRRVWLAAFLRGDAYFANAGLYPLGAPSPDRTPIVLVHGLASDPGAFLQIANRLARDPDLRRRYQTWMFFYPTGLPVLASSALLRKSLTEQIHELDPADTHPALHRAVLVGHSMGGLLSRLMVSDSGGDTFYRRYFRCPIDELKVPAEQRALLRSAFFFHAEPDVRAVVFIATPHRGSQLALTPLGSLGRMLVGLPRVMKKHIDELATSPGAVLAGVNLREENSVFGLSPRSTLIGALDIIPLRADRARLYSIIGDRGRPGPLAKSSDGVVPYESAHLPQARRETIVPAGHTPILKAPATLEEVARILRDEADR